MQARLTGDGVSHETTLTWIGQATIPRSDGLPVPTFTIHSTASALNRHGVGLAQSDGGIHTFSRRGYEPISFFADGAREADMFGDYRRLVWYSTPALGWPLQPVDPLTFSFVPFLFEEDGNHTSLGYPLQFTTSAEGREVRILSANGTALAIFQTASRAGLPHQVSIRTTGTSPYGASEWMLQLGAFIAGDGEPVLLETTTNPPLVASTARASMQAIPGPAGGVTYAPPLDFSGPPMERIPLALEAALRSPRMMAGGVEAKEQLLCSFAWRDKFFMHVDGNGNPIDPVGLAAPRHSFQVADLPIPAGGVPTTRTSEVQEANVSGTPLMPPAGTDSDSGPAFCSPYPASAVTEVPTWAVTTPQSVMDAATLLAGEGPNEFGWIVPNVSAPYWVFAAGCRGPAPHGASVLLFQAELGRLEFGFVHQPYIGPNACGMGQFPPLV